MPTPPDRVTISQVKGSHLIVQELRDELVVFDRRTSVAHLLNAPATAIYRAAEDGCSIDDVVNRVEGETDSQRRATAQLGVLDLKRAGLLMSDLPGVPRRSLLKTLGAAAAVPMVISILAPSPASAASAGASVCTGPGDTCATIGRNCVDGGNGGSAGDGIFHCCVATGDVLAGGACTTNADCCTNDCLGGSLTCNGS